jgi:HPt (histidine-containing phosphotransfer) domain-containing protein
MLAERIVGMRAALANGDRVVLRQLVHQVAGTGASFGFDMLTEEGRRLEANLVEGVATSGALSDFIALCDTVVASAAQSAVPAANHHD